MPVQGLWLLSLCLAEGAVIPATLRTTCLHTMTPFSLCSSVGQEAVGSQDWPGLRVSILTTIPEEPASSEKDRSGVGTRSLLLSYFMQTLCQFSVLLLLLKVQILCTQSQ